MINDIILSSYNDITKGFECCNIEKVYIIILFHSISNSCFSFYHYPQCIAMFVNTNISKYTTCKNTIISYTMHSQKWWWQQNSNRKLWQNQTQPNLKHSEKLSFYVQPEIDRLENAFKSSLQTIWNQKNQNRSRSLRIFSKNTLKYEFWAFSIILNTSRPFLVFESLKSTKRQMDKMRLGYNGMWCYVVQ